MRTQTIIFGSLALFWFLTNLQLLSLHSQNLALGQGNQQRTNTNSAATLLSLPRILALYFPQFHPDPINDRLWGVNFTDWDSLRRAPKTNRLGYQIPRPTELGYYDLSDTASDVRRKQGELAREYGIDAFAYHHYWFYDEEHPGPNLETPLELMLKDGEPDLPFCLHWAAMKWVNTWQSSGGNGSDQKQPKDGVLQLQNFPDPNEAEGRSKIEEHYNWLRLFFHHKNYIKINGQPLFMLYQKKPKAAPVLDEFRRLAIKDGFNGMYFTVGLTRPHADLQSFYPFRGIQRFKGFDTYNRTVAYPNPADWTNRTLTVPDWCLESSSNRGGIAVRRSDQQHSTEIPGIIVSFDNTPRRSFEEARILSDKDSEGVVATFRDSLKAAMHYEYCCIHKDAQDDAFILVNAWNEWAEGMTLEPSDVFGRKFLEAVREVKEEIVAQQCRRQTSSTDNRKAAEASNMNSVLAVVEDEADLLSKNVGKNVPFHYKAALVEELIMDNLISWG